MIRSLTGTLQSFFSEGIVLDVHGVGYEVHLNSEHINTLRIKQNETVRVSVYTHVKEDVLQLFGFLDEPGRELFVQLLSVSGVGPKTALSVLDKGNAAVITAIQQSDVAFFQGVPRLGKKTAQKIIVELQTKLGKVQELSLVPVSSTLQEVQDALVGMGFAPTEVRDVLLTVDSELDVAEALRFALKQLKRAK